MCHGADLGNAIEGWKRRPTDETRAAPSRCWARRTGRKAKGWVWGGRNDEMARWEWESRYESQGRVAAGPVTARVVVVVVQAGVGGWCW